MAGRKENLKSLFSNTRSRVIIIFTAVLLLLAVLIGYLKLRSINSGPEATATLSNAPAGIQSIPGVLDPTAQYAKLQEQQNVNQASTAEKTGGSAIPTIIRTQALGQGVGVVGSPSGVGFTTLAHEDQEGNQRHYWIQSLHNSECSKSSVEQAVKQGARLSDLKAGCSCAQLKDNGYSLIDLNQVCSCHELKAAGYNARQLKDIGYTAARLKDCGLNACELRNAGFTAQDMKDAGFSNDELKGAGFPEDDIDKASGLPAGITAADILKNDCNVDALAKLRQQGVGASAIRRINGCTPNQLKLAGYTPKELKDAGFSAAELKKAGLTPEQLKNAGYPGRDLLNAGLTPNDLMRTGYSPGQIKEAASELPAGISASDIKKAGCDVDVLKKERESGVGAALIRQQAGCSARDLKAAGFTDGDLDNAGFTPEEMSKILPLTDDQIRTAGCSPEQLKNLLAEGVSATQIKNLNACPVDALKNAGYPPQSLADSYTPAQLATAGFTPQQLAESSNPAEMLANGRSADCSNAFLRKAKAAGISAATIKKTLGCSAQALKGAGYTAKELKDAGFTPGELRNAGFTAKELKDAGFSPKELKDAGFSAGDLKNAGFTPTELRGAGFTADDLKNAGFTPEQLKAAGYEAKNLKDAGFSAARLKNAGFSAPELQQAGFTPDASELAKLNNSPQHPATFGLTAVPEHAKNIAKTADGSNQQLQAILNRQNQHMAEQKYQQRIQQKSSEMLSTANQLLTEWKNVPAQVYTAGNADKNLKGRAESDQASGSDSENYTNNSPGNNQSNQPAIIKTGDILFAVMDTAVNSDQPGPILATIVSGKLKGTKLIGSFNLPANSDQMVISFNTMSVPGAPKTTSISAYAVDPNTARTALSSKTNHHYFIRYGSLFASSFLEGFGNAFQSADTRVTIGGTGGGNDVTITNGVGRSTLENAVIGLATVGKTWGQQAQQLFNKPTTVEVYSGTPLGILFTQDVRTL